MKILVAGVNQRALKREDAQNAINAKIYDNEQAFREEWGWLDNQTDNGPHPYFFDDLLKKIKTEKVVKYITVYGDIFMFKVIV